LLGLVFAGTFAGVLASSASAALWLTFGQTRGAPGTVVTVKTQGSGALANIAPDSPPLRVFFVRTEHLGVTSPNDEHLIPLGELTVDAEGNGELRFTVPNVPSGDYVTLTHCIPCRPFSAGRELIPTGPDKPVGNAIAVEAPRGHRLKRRGYASPGTASRSS
jgi:hypothetical protein